MENFNSKKKKSLITHRLAHSKKLLLLTIIRKVTKRSDVERWSNEENLYTRWNERTQKLAEMIEPNSSVLEFGAGSMILCDYLPDKCTYTPSDIVDRGNNTLICDLNVLPLPNIPKHDVVVFSGVLEYIHNIPDLVSCLPSISSTIVTSYGVNDKKILPFNLARLSKGIVNNYSSQEFEQIFLQNGFFCMKKAAVGRQKIFKFVFGSSQPSFTCNSL